MGREEDGDGRIVHQVEYDGYSDRRWWHMLDDERWRAVPEQAGTGAGGAAADVDGDAAMDRADGERAPVPWATTRGREACGEYKVDPARPPALNKRRCPLQPAESFLARARAPPAARSSALSISLSG